MRIWLLIIFFFIYLIDPLKVGYIFGYLIFIVLAFNPDKSFLKLDRLGTIILVFSLTYSIFYSFNPDLGIQYIFIYGLFPLTFYVLGTYLFNEKKSLFSNISGLLIIAIIFSVSGILSTYNAIIESGYNIVNRNVNNFWTGQEENATYTGGFFLLNMCIPSVLIIAWSKIKNYQKIILILVYVVTLLAVLRLGSRTQLVISIFSIIGGILYLFFKQSSKKNFMLLAFIFLTGNIAFSYLSVGKDADFISAYTSRMESKKYGANTAGGRTERWEKSIQYLFEKPLGWELDEFGYSHNLWFDVLRVGGVISFLLLLLLSLMSIRMLYYKLKKDKTINPFLGTMTIYLLAFNLLFFVEPIFEGYFEVFVLYCFFLGLLSALKVNEEANNVIKD